MDISLNILGLFIIVWLPIMLFLSWKLAGKAGRSQPIALTIGFLTVFIPPLSVIFLIVLYALPQKIDK